MTGDVDGIIAKLKAAMKDGGVEDVEIFNRREVESLRRLIHLLEMFESWGKLGKVALWILTACAGAVIAWESIITRITGE